VRREGSLEAVAERVRSLEAQLEAARAERDRLVLRESARGVPRRSVAERAGLSAGRVQQIVDSH
jgi:hypothetical protein